MEELLKKIKGYEKFMATILGLVVLFIVCYKFVFLRELEERSRLLVEIETASFQFDLQEENKRSVEEIVKNFENYKKRLIEIREEYPPYMQYEEVMFVFKDFLSKTPFNVTGVDLSLYNPISAPSIRSEELMKRITDEDVLKKAEEMGFITNSEEYRFQNAVLEDGSAYGTNFSLVISGTMDVIRDFVKTVKDYNPKVVLTSFSLTGNEDGTVTAPIEFSFLGIMDKHVSNYSMLDKDYWKRTAISGKDNLFVRTDTDGQKTTDNIEEKYAYERADFTMRLLSYAEGITPPTVMISLKDPKEELNRVAQVYGDNQGEEKVQIDVNERDGKYFAKFKTEKENFPDENYEQEVEFEPKGDDLLLYIISMHRESEEDKSGVEITINNNTKKKFAVRIIDEDKDNPRVKVTNEDVMIYKG